MDSAARSTDLMLRETKISYIHNWKWHVLSESLAGSVGAKVYGIRRMPLHFLSGFAQCLWLAVTKPRSDVYFCESLMTVAVPWFKRVLFREKNLIVYRGIDSVFFRGDEDHLASRNRMKRAIVRSLVKKVDWVVADTELVRKDAQALGINAKVVYCGYSPDHDRLLKFKPVLKTNNFVFIGEYRPPYDHKDVERLVRIFNLVPQRIGLFVVGKDTQELRPLVKRPDIEVIGFAPSLDDVCAKATFYIHLPKYEAGPLTVHEAMLRGQIPVVNDMTGLQTLVAQVDQRLVIPSKLSDTETAKRIARIAAASPAQRAVWSKRSRQIARKLSKEYTLRVFQKGMADIIRSAGRQAEPGTRGKPIAR
jgi:hypothetical protein